MTKPSAIFHLTLVIGLVALGIVNIVHGQEWWRVVVPLALASGNLYFLVDGLRSE